MAKTEKKESNDVVDLLQSLQNAVKDRDEKEMAREAAAMDLDAATKAYQAAAEYVSGLQAQLNNILGMTRNDRVRMSA